MLLCTKANHKPNWQQSECTSGCTPMLGQINPQLIREFECFFTSHWRLYDKVTNYYIFWKWWNCQSHNNIVNFLEILGDTSIKYVSVLPNIKLLISSTVQNKKTKKKKTCFSYKLCGNLPIVSLMFENWFGLYMHLTFSSEKTARRTPLSLNEIVDKIMDIS